MIGSKSANHPLRGRSGRRPEEVDVSDEPSWIAEGALDVRRTRPWEDTLSVPYLVERKGLDLDRLAVVAESRTRTYGDLRRYARRVAHGLIDLGLRPFDRVAVLLSNELEFLEIEVGIAGARGIMVGLNWRLTARELGAILRTAQPRVLIGQAPYLENIHRLRERGDLPGLETVIELGGDGADITYEDLLERGRDAPMPRSGRLHEPHEIIFTSGTTGDPKGAVWTHGSLLFNAMQQVMDYRLSSEHSTYVMIDLYYVGGRHDLTFSLLYQGGTVHLKRSSGFDAPAILDYVERHDITHLLWVPAMLHDVLPAMAARGGAPTSIEFVMSGGAPIPRHMLEECFRLMPNAEVVQVYGMTEGGGSVTNLPARYARSKLGSCGRASQHVDIAVVREDGSPCRSGEEGEVLVRGPSLAAGYWSKRDRTEQTFRDGWLHSGDIGYLDPDGFLFISGRQKEMIISGGMNIFPAEIEEAVSLHPAVSEVAVVGAPDDRFGERVVACVKVVEGASVTPEELTAHSRQLLASYKKPREYVFLDQFPRTASGKVKKHELSEQVRHG